MAACTMVNLVVITLDEFAFEGPGSINSVLLGMQVVKLATAAACWGQHVPDCCIIFGA